MFVPNSMCVPDIYYRIQTTVQTRVSFKTYQDKIWISLQVEYNLSIQGLYAMMHVKKHIKSTSGNRDVIVSHGICDHYFDPCTISIVKY